MPLEFDQLLEKLDALRAEAERERFIEASHQLQAVLDYMRWRNRTFSARVLETWAGDVPSTKH